MSRLLRRHAIQAHQYECFSRKLDASCGKHEAGIIVNVFGFEFIENMTALKSWLLLGDSSLIDFARKLLEKFFSIRRSGQEPCLFHLF